MCCILSVGPLLIPRTLKHKSKKEMSVILRTTHADVCRLFERAGPYNPLLRFSGMGLVEAEEDLHVALGF